MTLYWCRKISFLNLIFHLPKAGGMSLKISSFRAFQIFQVTHTKTSRKHGPVCLILAASTRWKIVTRGLHVTPTVSQQSLANAQSKNRWSLVSNMFWSQRTQLTPPQYANVFDASDPLCSVCLVEATKQKP